MKVDLSVIGGSYYEGVVWTLASGLVVQDITRCLYVAFVWKVVSYHSVVEVVALQAVVSIETRSSSSWPLSIFSQYKLVTARTDILAGMRAVVDLQASVTSRPVSGKLTFLPPPVSPIANYLILFLQHDMILVLPTVNIISTSSNPPLQTSKKRSVYKTSLFIIY